ncbi:MAG: chromate efflux transporter [Desulfitobacteriaceae bacterium]
MREEIKVRELKVRLIDIFLVFLKMGLTAFGPSMIVEAKKQIVRRKGWISEQEVLTGLALAQFLPGATYANFAVFLGYSIRKLQGAIVSFLGFILPPFTLMLVLAYLYFRYSDIPVVLTMLRGLQAIVFALIANAIWELAKLVLKDWQALLILAISIILGWANPNIFLSLFCAGLLSIGLYRPWRNKGKQCKVISDHKNDHYWREVIIVISVLLAISAISAFNPLILKLEVVFFKIGLLVFGNGFTMIPLIQHEVVNVYHWLDDSQFRVGIALGQITPGPVVITATFVGYKVLGLLGALAATLGIFAPSFLLVVLVMPFYQRLREHAWVKVIFNGVLVAFVGLMLIVLFNMSKQSLVDPLTICFAIFALISLRVWKVEVLWVVLGGTSLYLLCVNVLNL